MISWPDYIWIQHQSAMFRSRFFKISSIPSHIKGCYLIYSDRFSLTPSESSDWINAVVRKVQDRRLKRVGFFNNWKMSRGYSSYFISKDGILFETNTVVLWNIYFLFERVYCRFYAECSSQFSCDISSALFYEYYRQWLRAFERNNMWPLHRRVTLLNFVLKNISMHKRQNRILC